MMHMAGMWQGRAINIRRLAKAVIICWYIVSVSTVGAVMNCEEAAAGKEMFRT
jgi:hypothetical protein